MPPPTIAHYNGTLQWHPAMAPSNVHRPLPQSWLSPSPQTVANYNGTLQWHHVHTPKLVVTPPNPSTLQCHPAMAPRQLPKLVVTPLTAPPQTIAHYQWHPAMAPRPLLQSWPSPSPAPTGAPRNRPKVGLHPPPTTTCSAPCNGTLVPRPIRQSGSSPSPSIRSKNPYSYRYLGKKKLSGFPNQELKAYTEMKLSKLSQARYVQNRSYEQNCQSRKEMFGYTAIV